MGEGTTITEKPQCRYCGKQLYGRAGKIFCNVDCKNNYNSRIRSAKRATENGLFPQVIGAIKQNYRVLSGYNLEKETKIGTLMVMREDLKKLGFDPRYCTSAKLDHNQKLWKCCFNQCWSGDGDYLELKYMPEILNY